MKYLRSYPLVIQWVVFWLLFMLLLFASKALLVGLFTRITGYSFSQLISISPSSPQALINGSLAVNGIANLMTFCLSAYLFAYLAHPRPAQYMGLTEPVLKIQLVLVVLLMLGAMPLLMGLENLVGHINFGSDVKKMQQDDENMMNAFLDIHSAGGMAKVLLLMAVVPAVGEELFFRGVFMRLMRKFTRSMLWSVIFSATFFAVLHANVYGMASIFLAGILLAVIYYLTGSLWCSIVAHLFFNGTTIVTSYLYSGTAEKENMDSNTLPVMYLVAGAILFAGSLYLLIKNKTPLPKNWADDFSPKEPRDDEWDFMTNK